MRRHKNDMKNIVFRRRVSGKHFIGADETSRRDAGHKRLQNAFSHRARAHDRHVRSVRRGELAKNHEISCVVRGIVTGRSTTKERHVGFVEKLRRCDIATHPLGVRHELSRLIGRPHSQRVSNSRTNRKRGD
jgi:hypothetical protein